MSDFGRELGLLIPRLRRYARALTRDVNRADDLVQECLVRALAKQHLFQPGTDLRAWLFTLLHNQHVNEIRRAAPFGNPAEVDELAPVAVEGNAIPSVELKDLERAIAKLPIEQRQAVLLVGLEGMPYDEVASVLNVPIGTVRSRLSRGRDLLRNLMGMQEQRLGSAPQSVMEETTRPRATWAQKVARAA
jgi:RNA polymerase sigma-70 factor, ECF subfamily